MFQRILIVILMVFMGFGLTYGQRDAENDEKIPKSRQQQQQDFKDQKAAFPPAPRNMWAIGLVGGTTLISGDVKTNFTARGKDHFPAWAAGFTVRKALGYVVSIRGEYAHAVTYGQNWQATSGILNNPALNGKWDPEIDYTKPNGPGYVFHNYKSTLNDFSVQAVFNLNNLKFHTQEPKLSFYAVAGLGGLTYETLIDQLDADGNIYDYSEAFSIAGNDQSNRDEILNELGNLYDSEYETAAEHHTDDFEAFNRSWQPIGIFGGGFSILLGTRVAIGLEHQVKLTSDDLLDGQRWEETNTLTRGFDAYHYTSLRLTFHLGNKGRNDIPHWWVNPLSFEYNQLANNLPEDMADDDGDGVLNIADQEPETEEGYPVDTRGVTLDSDKDGCPDGEDPEPFSSPELPIRNCVNVHNQGLDEDDVRKIVAEMMGDPSISAGGSDWYLPMIHFDLNKSDIKPEFIPELKRVAEILQRYPSLKVDVIGYTDIRGGEDFNLDLSRKRAQSAIEYMVQRYKIPENRFVLHFMGEHENLVPGAVFENEHYLNRRVEFRIVE